MKTVFLFIALIVLIFPFDGVDAQTTCPTNICGTGQCFLTTNPSFPYACKCQDGSYQFTPCQSNLLINSWKIKKNMFAFILLNTKYKWKF